MSLYVLWVRIDPLSVSEQHEYEDIREIVDNLSEMSQSSGSGKVQMGIKITDTIVGSLLPRLQKLQGVIYEEVVSDRGIVG